MIYATGYVTIAENPNARLRKKIKRKYLTLEYVEEETINDALKVKYAYTVFLPRSQECRFLEDYTGKIKPFIEQHASKRVVSLQVTHLNYVSEDTMRKMKRK